MMQDKLLLGFGVGDARQADSTPFAQIKPQPELATFVFCV
jgi:hypothetical protein